MKANAKELVTALKAVIPVTSSNSIPIYAMALFGDKQITASTIGKEITANINCQFEPFCADPRKVLSFAERFDGDIVFELEGSSLTLKCGKARQKLNAMESSDFPDFRTSISDREIDADVDADDLNDIIAIGGWCCGVNDVRHFLNGMHITFGDGFTQIVCSNGSVLYKTTMTLSLGVDYSVIVPVDSLKTFSSVKGKSIFSTTGTNTSARSVAIRNEKIRFRTSLVDGKYPEFDRMLNSNRDCAVTVDAKEMIKAIEPIIKLHSAKGDHYGMTLTFGCNSCMIHSLNKENEEYVSEIPTTKVSGEDSSISINAEYLLNSLKGISKAHNIARLSVMDGRGLFVEAGRHLFLIMGMRL